MDPLQDEETQLAATLSSLEAVTSRHITELFGSSLDDRATFNAQSTKIREDLAALRAATRDLAILAEEHDTEEQSSRLAEMLKGHQAEYEKLQTAFKQANVQARRNTEAAAVEARKAMLAGGQAHTVPARAAGQADSVAASQGITKSLLRTRQLMAQELEHTSATLAAMDASNERLAEGREELRGHRGLFSGSRHLLRALFRSSVLDTISLYGGLAIFFFVVAYILQKRTLYFAPIGKVMAPVAGTAWNASRSAAQRAGQLPSAVLALHRRLNAKGHGAPLLVDDELPASVDRVLQDDSPGDRHLEEVWKQQPTPPNEQQGADAGSGAAADEAMQQGAEAEPELLADIPAPPDETAPVDQPAKQQPTVGTGPAAELPSDAAEPTSMLDPVVVTNKALGDMPDAEQPSQTSNDAGTGDFGSDPPVAVPASGSDAYEQPATAEKPDEPADAIAGVPLPADTAASDEAAVHAEEGSSGCEAPVSTPNEQLGEAAAAGVAGRTAADAPGPVPAAADRALQPDAAADGSPVGTISVDDAGDGMLGLQPDSQEADRQSDVTDMHGSPAGKSPAAMQEAASKGAADTVLAAAPEAEPVTEPPPAGSGEENGMFKAPEKGQVELPVPAPAADAGIKPPDSKPAEVPPDADATSDTAGDAAEQLAAPPADVPAHVQAEDDGITEAAEPLHAEALVPSSTGADDVSAGEPEDQPSAAHVAAQVTPQPAAASKGASPMESEGSAAQRQDAHVDMMGDDTATAPQPKLPEPAAVEADTGAADGAAGAEPAGEPSAEDHATAPLMEPEQPGLAAAAGGEADSQQERSPAAAVDDSETPPGKDVQQAPPAEPMLPAEPAAEVEAAAAPSSDSMPLPDAQPAATAHGDTGLDMQQPEGAGGMRPADGEQTPAEGMPEPAAAPTPEENVIYDEQGNKFEWRWHPEAGADGRWKLYAAGTDRLVHEQPDDEAAASKGTAPPEAVPVDQSEATSIAQAPAQEQAAPAAEVVRDEL